MLDLDAVPARRVHNECATYLSKKLDFIAQLNISSSKCNQREVSMHSCPPVYFLMINQLCLCRISNIFTYLVKSN